MANKKASNIVIKDPFDDDPPPRPKTSGMSNPGVSYISGNPSMMWSNPTMVPISISGSGVPMMAGPPMPPASSHAPAVHHCGTCHREIRESEASSALQCDVPTYGCKEWFHGQCSGLTDPALRLLKDEVWAHWICKRCFDKNPKMDLVQPGN